MRSKFKWIFTLLLALTMQFSFAQEKAITGVVTDANGPLPGVNVVVKGTQRGVSSGFDGKYSIKAKEGETLVFSFMGMREVSKVVGASNVINTVMQSDAKQFGDVVIVGFAKQEKKKMIQSVVTVGSDKIKDVPVASVQDVLQGQTSGVQVVSSSGVIGSAPVVKVRGVASITAGARPLYVVDGVPLNDVNLTSAQGGQALNPIADLNPADIESMSVLKDAAATSIYGSRGSNGVILITTKMGKRNQDAKVAVGFTTSFTNYTDAMKMMNASQYKEYNAKFPQALTNSGVTIDDIGETNFDWLNAVSRTGVSMGSDVSVSGGSEKTTYFLGGSYAKQSGFIIGNGLEKSAGRLNINTEANSWLKVGMNLGVTTSKIDRVASENSVNAPFTSAFLQEPYVTPYDANGNFQRTGFIANVVAIEALNINDLITNRITGNVFADFKLFKPLTYRVEVGLDRSSIEEFRREKDINQAGGSASDYQAVQQKTIFTNTLNFNKKLAEKINLNALVGFTAENTEVRDISVAGTVFASDDFLNVTSAVIKSTTDNTNAQSRLNGYFSRFNLDYDSKYLLEASFRRDGSSRFGSNNRFGNFWAIGAAWNIASENFLKESKYISELKLKANMGVSGNDRIGDYAWRERVNGGIYPNYNETSGLALYRFSNPNLKWERSESVDFGLNLGMFSDRVKIAVDVYRKVTSDLLLNKLLSTADNDGVRTYLINAGKMENKGLDLDFNFDVLRDSKLKWSTNLNFNFNRNKILELNSDASVDAQGNKFIGGSTYQRAIEGYSANTFYLVPYLGVNKETGHAEWLDINGNPTTTYSTANRRIVGDANPDFTGGWSNNLKYGNFDLSTLVNFSYGNDIFVDGLRFVDRATYAYNHREVVGNVWQKSGDDAFTPNPTSPTFRTVQNASTRQLKDGSFARLKNVTFGYNFPMSKFSKSFISSVRIYATAQNLYTLKNKELQGIDPEVSNSISAGIQGETFFTAPQTKTFLFGTRLTF
ncbi:MULTISPECIES: SusC/RagA family TonB-linked outer membrane protein [Flavobacterium]|uniref:SusC/RagA family TonB-linked outer membrane protein n=1 Tax=Flavobacterium covae TaxID=2906076 RepID=A0ABW8PES9_9FLAO|nr:MULTISPECIES: SusC/RagA family TonB-linked outer membrane protein [Flavobacterium]AND63334.1 hypothetical protein AX766_02295 [Flavobacterium covae]MCJ1805778.1 SusC/RagA family TonB-linked outer membrane protein [Flavobacterium covae]MCJ1809504.1 SusC/RagA family TonB-linked outer membrane protein [Flavobacterium covae]OWP82042.1 hypothetical protein BWK63_02795 [Flavobacterium covae]POR23624.1 hypothetical protein BWK57_00960 [Flavobacterium columnare]